MPCYRIRRRRVATTFRRRIRRAKTSNSLPDVMIHPKLTHLSHLLPLPSQHSLRQPRRSEARARCLQVHRGQAQLRHLPGAYPEIQISNERDWTTELHAALDARTAQTSRVSTRASLEFAGTPSAFTKRQNTRSTQASASRKLTSLALSSTLQVNPVYVVCHEDRAFLCRSCDISIHSANAHVAKHQRFLMTGVSLELEAVGAAAKEGEVAETPVVAQAPMAKKAKGIKRKMEHQFQAPSASSEDGLVPSMGGAEAAADPMASEEEFNSFVQDFLGNTKEGKDGNMADFLDNFFDDIPAVGNDFGVVPVM